MLNIREDICVIITKLYLGMLLNSCVNITTPCHSELVPSIRDFGEVIYYLVGYGLQIELQEGPNK